MDWNEDTLRYHEMTFSNDCQLSSLAEDWQRELAALWRLEADVNNGAYLQFLANWGRESFEFATRGLKRMGAAKMARIVEDCQKLVDEHYDSRGKTQDQLRELIPNEGRDQHGNLIKEAGSVLPDSIVNRIYDLSYEFMEYPDDIIDLGTRCYQRFVDSDLDQRNGETTPERNWENRWR